MINKLAIVSAMVAFLPVAAAAAPASDAVKSQDRVAASANRPDASVLGAYVEYLPAHGPDTVLGTVGKALRAPFDAVSAVLGAATSTVTADAKDDSREREIVERERRHLAAFGVSMNSDIQKYVSYYTEGRGRGVAIRGIVRSNPLVETAEQIFREEGAPSELVWLAQTESGWRSVAVSPVGAGGVWQFMPATAKRFGMQVGEGVDERADFEKSTRAAAKYLRWLADRYNGNWPLAIGAYNCGEGAMDKAIARAGVADFWEIRRRNLLPKETAEYVPSVLASSVFGTSPDEFALDGREAVLMTINGRGAVAAKPATPAVAAPAPQEVLVAAKADAPKASKKAAKPETSTKSIAHSSTRVAKR